MAPIARIARFVLAATLLSLTVAKILDGFDSRGVEQFAPLGLARATTVALVLLEAGIGLLLLAGPRPRALALVAAAILLFLYGVGALLRQTEICTCAGRIAQLRPLQHTVLLATLLVLTGLASAERSTMNVLTSWKRLWPWATLVTVVALLGMAATQVWPSHDESTPMRAVVTVEPLDCAEPLLRGRAGAASDSHPPPARSLPAPPPDGLVLRGLVVDEAGTGVSEARVWVASPTAGFGSFDSTRTLADAQGHFSLEVSGPASGTNLHAFKEGYRPAWLPAADADLKDGVTLVLERGLRVRGRVVDPSGSGLPGVRVEALGIRAEDFAVSKSCYGEDAAPAYGATSTSAEGAFDLTGLTAGEYRLRAHAPGYYMPEARGSVTVTARGPAASRDIVVYPVLVARLTLVDAETGEPVRTACVGGRGKGIRVIDSQDYRSPVSDSRRDALVLTGTYAIHAVARGPDTKRRMEVHVEAPGYAATVAAFELETYPGTPKAVKLQRCGPIVAVTLCAAFDGASERFTGVLNLLLRGLEQDGARSFRMPIRLVEGCTREPVPIGAGSYRAWLESAIGSTACWTPASRVRAVDIRGDAQTVDLELEGGVLRVRALDGKGVALPEFGLSVARGNLAAVVRTWQDQLPPVATPDGARLFWLPPGPARVGIVKFGYEVSRRDIVVPRDGGSVDLDFMLVPRPQSGS